MCRKYIRNTIGLILVLLFLFSCCAENTETAEYAASDFYYLIKGDRGEEVKALQTRLIELGYLSGSADGSFGSGTQEP